MVQIPSTLVKLNRTTPWFSTTLNGARSVCNLECGCERQINAAAKLCGPFVWHGVHPPMSELHYYNPGPNYRTVQAAWHMVYCPVELYVLWENEVLWSAIILTDGRRLQSGAKYKSLARTKHRQCDHHTWSHTHTFIYFSVWGTYVLTHLCKRTRTHTETCQVLSGHLWPEDRHTRKQRHKCAQKTHQSVGVCACVCISGHTLSISVCARVCVSTPRSMLKAGRRGGGRN